MVSRYSVFTWILGALVMDRLLLVPDQINLKLAWVCLNELHKHNLKQKKNKKILG